MGRGGGGKRRTECGSEDQRSADALQNSLTQQPDHEGSTNTSQGARTYSTRHADNTIYKCPGISVFKGRCTPGPNRLRSAAIFISGGGCTIPARLLRERARAARRHHLQPILGPGARPPAAMAQKRAASASPKTATIVPSAAGRSGPGMLRRTHTTDHYCIGPGVRRCGPSVAGRRVATHCMMGACARISAYSAGGGAPPDAPERLRT